MAMQNFSLHTHTIGFDGQNTVTEMVEKAKQLNFTSLGISNHFIVYPNIKETKMYEAALKRGYENIYSATFDEAVEKFQRHYEEIDKVGQKTKFKIYKGMEVDFFRDYGWQKGFEKAYEILKPDYLIGSAHFVEFSNTLYNSHDLKNASREEQNLLLYKYYQNLRGAAKSGLFNFMAHMDLMKKVGLGIGNEWKDEEKRTIEVFATSKAKVEINTSGFKLGYDEPYPSKRIMNLLAEYKIPVIISDDAHKAENLGYHFERAAQMAQESGIKHFYNPFAINPVSLHKKELII